MKNTLFAVLLCAIAALVAPPVLWTTPLQQPPPTPDMEPWVAFDADWYQDNTHGVHWIGRMNQDSDGSLRIEQWTWDENFRSISIQDHKTNRYFLKQTTSWDDSGWTSEPLVKRTRWAPKPGMVGLADRGAKVEGFRVVEYDVPGQPGTMYTFAPDLNYTMLISARNDFDEQHRVTRTLSNIKVRPQDPALFSPPAGVQITERPAAKERAQAQGPPQ